MRSLISLRVIPGGAVAPFAALVFVLVTALGWCGAEVSAQGREFEKGDLFVSVGDGVIRWMDESGNGIRDLETRDDNPQSDEGQITDLCFDDQGNLYTMNFHTHTISVFDRTGELIEAAWADAWSGTFEQFGPETCAFARDGSMLVGESIRLVEAAGDDGRADDGARLLRISREGDVLEVFEPPLDRSGVDQIALAKDQCTVYYTSEGPDIMAYDVCEDRELAEVVHLALSADGCTYYSRTADNSISAFDSCLGIQLSDVEAFPSVSEQLNVGCSKVRIRPNSELLVGCRDSVIRVDPEGSIIRVFVFDQQVYSINLARDDRHMMATAYRSGDIYRVNIESGFGTEDVFLETAVNPVELDGGLISGIGAVAVYGEIIPGEEGHSGPEIVQYVAGPNDISTDPAVVGTNLLLAVVVLVLLLASATVFNETIQENYGAVEGWASHVVRPLETGVNQVRIVLDRLTSWSPGLRKLVGPGLVLIAAATIYGLLEPNFGPDENGATVFAGMLAGIAGVTYVWEGGQALLTRRWGGNAAVRVFPIAMVIACISVLVSRLTGFLPGIVYGFIAASAVTAEVSLDRRQGARLVLYPALALSGIALLAWFALVPFGELADDSTSWPGRAPEGVAALFVLVAVEALAFSMIPATFVDGKKIWEWSKPVWFAVTALLFFVFFHVLINHQRSDLEAFRQQSVVVVLTAVGACLAASTCAWLLFKRHATRRLLAGQDATDSPSATEP